MTIVCCYYDLITTGTGTDFWVISGWLAAKIEGRCTWRANNLVWTLSGNALGALIRAGVSADVFIFKYSCERASTAVASAAAAAVCCVVCGGLRVSSATARTNTHEMRARAVSRPAVCVALVACLHNLHDSSLCSGAQTCRTCARECLIINSTHARRRRRRHYAHA